MTTPDSHHLDEEQLSSLVDERLEPADRARAEAHVDDCARCRGHLDGLRATVALLRRLPELEPPRSFELAETTGRPLALRLVPWTRAAGALAAALFVVLVSADLLGGRPVGAPADIGAPAVAPVPRAAEAPRLAAPAAPAGPAQQPPSAGAGASGAAQAPAAAPPAAAATEPTAATPAAQLAPTRPPAPAPVARPLVPAGSLLRAGEVAIALLAAVLLLASFFLPHLAGRAR